ncbi:hypothetical protein GCK72_005963 [Caenorhabditis remanei]|uniref:Uncharacterized protein n=1 Tax=Caenorhabditis remanei TaxID=31234 RepID=A0A6A5HE11_CAERE|nr:hypothetical protein GCK72_005963 [Caenorhabditis remanei]KAF1766008.1 hypothetical protein GCK72_005963 [Caenorhabditis remanei]
MPQDSSDGYERLADITEAAKNEGSELKHVIRDVIRHYSDLSSDLHDYYEKNLKKCPEVVDQTVNDLYNSAQNFKDNLNIFVDSMMDLSPPEKISGFNISKIFANSIFLLLISSMSLFIGSYITAPVFGVIFLNLGAVLVATIAIPVTASYVYHNLKVRSLAEKRIACAGFIFIQSVLIGFINQNDWLESSPYAVLTQIISSFVYPLALAHTDNRKKILGFVAGSILLFNVSHGFLASGMDGTFLTISILYTLLSISLIQYSIAFRCLTDFDMMHSSMQYVLLISVSKMFVLMSLGNHK